MYIMFRLLCLIKMFVRLMLPLSIIQSSAFNEFLGEFDPSFTVPTRPTIKGTGLSKFMEKVNLKIRSILSTIEWVNISIDGWSDPTARSFIGYVAQGIDNNWVLHTIVIAFKYTTGKHTG